MILTKEISIEDFGAWSDGEKTLNKIIEENKAEEFERLINELYPDGIDETTLNDLLRFEDNWIYNTLDIEV